MNATAYKEVIRKHASSNERYRTALSERVLVHTITSLNVVDHPEHRDAIQARKYLKDVSCQEGDAIPRAFDAIKDLIDAGLATFMPTKFISDGRDTSSMVPPYPYLCNPEQILNYSTSRDARFWDWPTIGLSTATDGESAKYFSTQAQQDWKDSRTTDNPSEMVRNKGMPCYATVGVLTADRI